MDLVSGVEEKRRFKRKKIFASRTEKEMEGNILEKEKLLRMEGRK